MSFALDPAWSKLQAELFTSGLSAAQPNPAWTLWVKNATTAAAASAASSPPQRSPAPFLLNQNYVLFRYLQLIQGNGSTAIHFNGGIIDWGATGNPGTPSNVHDHGSPDYRQWGAGFWCALATPRLAHINPCRRTTLVLNARTMSYLQVPKCTHGLLPESPGQ